MSFSFDEFLADSRVIEDLREDVNVPLNAFAMTDDRKLKSNTYGELELSDAAFKKLAQMYKFSLGHLKVLQDAGLDDLIAEQFNRFMEKDRNIQKFRLIEDRVQGIVNKHYKKYDNFDVFSQTAEYFIKNGFDYEVDIVQNNDEYTRIRFIVNDINKNFGMADEGGIDNDIVKGGFEITNSEIGAKSMGINSLLYRQICTNGMMASIGGTDNDEIFYKRGNNFSVFSREPLLINGLNKSVNRSKNNLEVFSKTKDIIIPDPRDEFEKIGSRYNLAREHVNGFNKSYKSEQQRNLFGVVNAVTRHGRDFKDYPNRSRFEFIANDIVDKAVTIV